MVPPADRALALNEFPSATREDWRKLVQRVLKGAPFDQRLVSTTYDRLRIEPLYEPLLEAAPLTGRAAGPWQVMQRVDHPDPAMANAQALRDLQNGARGLTLVCAGSAGAYGYGLGPEAGAIERVLDDVHLDAGISIEFNLSPQAKDMPLALAALVRDRRISPDAVDIRFGLDPLGAVALSGGFPLPWPEVAKLAAGLATDIAAQGFSRRIMVADGRLVHAAGGSEAQELAYVLAAAVAYLRALQAAGIPLDGARRMLFFRLAADADQFLTIAKFRALRRLWGRIEQACGLDPQPAFISAESAWRMMTKRDPWVNMLRTTLATFAAGIGGADAITALPFTAARGLPDDFARRLARNTQLILLEESNLAKVLDPAAGSGGVEALTESLAKAAWTLFQEFEAAGGAAIALERGLIQQKISETRRQRASAVARRKETIVGSSEFPHLQEMPVAVMEIAPRPELPAMPCLLKIEPLPPMRLAEPFEKLRDAADRMVATSGARPRVFLAPLGAPADFTARATFAKNFFEAGGIKAVSSQDVISPDPTLMDSGLAPAARPGMTNEMGELSAAFRASGAALACLCSSDEVYGREGAGASHALKQAGAKHIYLAGRPADQESALRAAGVQTFIYAGCDALATLQAAHDILGIDEGRPGNPQ
jgi:methylmalonyl-CoA mutase